MAPMKNVNRLPKKVAKKRTCKSNPVKAPLKIPTCIKVKIGSIGSKPPKIERKVTRQRKIELANEVAMEQLTSLTEPKVTVSATVPAPIKMEPKITEVKTKSAPKLKRKLPVKIQESDHTPAKKTAKQNECKPKRGRKPTVKAAETSPLKSSPTLNNIQSDSEPESWQVISKRPGPKSRTMPIETKLETEKAKSETAVTSVQENIVKSVKKNATARTQQKVTNYFTNFKSDVTPKTAVTRTKKKPTPKKRVIEDAKTKAAAKQKGRTRSKFVTERHATTKVTRSKGKVLNMKDIQSAASILDKAMKEPANVKTRSSSVNSTNSNLSWTRDISTASSLTSDTTTCVTVCSTDFVRFDNKLPFVQIENNVEQLQPLDVKDKLLENSSSSDSDSSSDSSTDSEIDGDIVSNKPELNLSSSSLTAPSPQYEGRSDNTEQLCVEMEKLSNSLKNFYSEMGKWLVFDDDNDNETFSSILEAMNLEKDLISNCDKFNSILGNVCEQKSSPEKHPGTSNEMQAETKSDDRRLDEKSDPSRENIPYYDSPQKSTKSNSSGTFTSDNYNYVSFEDKMCDDEDTLSLFAESITGIESSRISSVSNMSIQEHIAKPIQRLQESHDTYIPKPTRPWLFERYNYLPTRIEREPQKRIEDIPLKTLEPNMVEKQNADSSSIKDDLSKKAMDLLEDANKLSELANASINSESNKPRRIFSRYHAVPCVKSSLYLGYCFFSAACQCKNNNCRFPHKEIPPGELSRRLTVLTEDSIIEEYLLMIKYNNLRRKFGLLYMKECARRNATRILMEMAIDLGLGVVERVNMILNVNALETTLLHLNSAGIDACGDLLAFKYNDTMLCDALIRCMAYSQNFSQFKQVFVKLSEYMEQIKRPVDIAIVGNILERVCILPCEESIARAMLSLMTNTDARIFENNMTKSFEFQLSNTKSNVYEQYLLAKKKAMEALLNLVEDSTTSESPVPRVVREGPRHPSPDTTNLDSLKKAQMAQPTTFKRTIDTDVIRDLFKSPSNPAPKRRYNAPRQWRKDTRFTQPPIPVRLVNRRIYHERNCMYQS